jgi:hypothetical protein
MIHAKKGHESRQKKWADQNMVVLAHIVRHEEHNTFQDNITQIRGN